MHITLHRSGGFANVPLHRTVDTATAPGGAEIERLAAIARATPPPSAPMPDAYMYELTIDGEPYTVINADGPWAELIARIERA